MRGGDGGVRRVRFLEAMTASILSNGRVHPAFGLAGGQAVPQALADDLQLHWFDVRAGLEGDAAGKPGPDDPYAQKLGVDVDKTISITFIMGAALAAVAGTLFLMYYGVIAFSDGFVPGVKAFTAAVLGGIGSLPGAVIGGLAIGLIESLWSAYFSIDYKDVAAFSILAIVLIFLPSGILGRPEVEKV